MTTKEKIIRKSIKSVTKRLFEIKGIMDARPLIEILENRKSAQLLLKTTSREDQCSKTFMSALKALANREKELIELAEKQQDMVNLIKKRADLELELSDLNSELFWIEQRKQSR